MNCFFRIFLVVFCFGNVFAAASSSEPAKDYNIWRAIELYEAKKDGEARAIFVNFKNSPVARPYCVALGIELPASLMPDHPTYKEYRTYFNVSTKIRLGYRLNVKKDGIAVHYAQKSYESALTNADFRAIFKMRRVVIEDMDVESIAHMLRRNNGNIPQNLFDLARLFELKGKISSASGIYTQAAALGHSGAQYKVMTKLCSSDKQVFFWAMYLAEQNSLEGLDVLANFYEHGKGSFLPIDRKKAFFFYKKSADLSDAEMTSGLKVHSLDYYAQVFVNLGVAYMDGIGTPVDCAQSESYFRKAVDLGHEVSKSSLLRMIQLQGKEDLALLQEVAERGNLGAQLGWVQWQFQNNTGDTEKMLLMLNDVAKNLTASKDEKGSAYYLLYHITQNISYLHTSVSYGCVRAMLCLGQLYSQGIGVEKNSVLAIDYLSRALLLGSQYGNLSLGFTYMGLSRDLEAVECFNRALLLQFPEEQPDSAYNLCLLFMHNRGNLHYTPAELQHLLSIAINDDDKDACALMGILYREGLYGFEKNEGESQKYLVTVNDGVIIKALMDVALGVESRYGVDSFDTIYQLIHEAAILGHDAGRLNLVLYYSSGVEGKLIKDVKIATRIAKYMKPGFYKMLAEWLLRKVEEPVEEPVEIEKISIASCSSSSSSSSSSIPVVEEVVFEPETEITRLQRKFQKNFQGKRQVKWRKMQKFMRQVMKAEGGHMKTGKGSGTRLRVGDTYSGLHIPHGRNASELTGGRLESMLSLLRKN